MRKLLLTMFTAMTLSLGLAEAAPGPSPSPSPAPAAQEYYPRATRSDWPRRSTRARYYRRHRAVIVDPYVRRRVYTNRYRGGYYNSYPRRTSSERVLVVPRRTSLR